MQSISSAKTILGILLLSIILSSAHPSLAAAPAAYVAHENPYNVTAVSGNIDYKTMAVLYDLYFGLNKVANDIKASDLKKAKVDYQSFYALYAENYNVLQRLFSSEADAEESIQAMNVTADDISTMLDYMDRYNEDFSLYSQAVARGDSQGATVYAARLQDNYKKLSAVYGDFNAHSTTAIDTFYNTNYGNIDASPLYPLRQVADDYMLNIDDEYQNVSTEYGIYKLTLAASKSDASLGDTVVFTLFLARLDTSPVAGKDVTLYVDDTFAGNATTGTDGRCSITYRVPHGTRKETLAVYAESYPESYAIPPMLSNRVQLHVRDEPTALAMSFSPGDAEFGDTIRVSGSLTLEDGTPVPPGEVAAYVNGVKAGSGRTNGSGFYDYGFPITQTTPGGNCTINTAYTQSPGEIYLNSTSPSGSINITILDTSLALNVPGDWFGNGDTFNFTGGLITEKGDPVGGARVQAYIDDTRLGENRTDVHGNYTIPVTIPYGIAAGSHSFSVRYAPGNTALRGTASQLNVTIVAVEPVIDVVGAPLVLFKDDPLSLNGSVHARNGAPIYGQAFNVNVSDTINGVVTTDRQGRFNFTQAVPGDGLPGIRQLTVSPASADPGAQKYTYYGGSILLIPFDKGPVAVFIIIVVALMILGLLAIWQRITPGRLLLLARRMARPEKPAPRASEEEPPEAVPEPPKTPDFAQIAGRIHDMLGTGDHRETSRTIYLAARGIYDTYGDPIPGAATHNEFYREAAARDASVAGPLKHIIDLYEITNFGHGEASAQDMESAYRGLRDVYRAVTREAP